MSPGYGRGGIWWKFTDKNPKHIRAAAKGKRPASQTLKREKGGARRGGFLMYRPHRVGTWQAL